MKKFLSYSIFVLFIFSNFQSHFENIKYFKSDNNNNHLEKNVIISFTSYKNRLQTSTINRMIDTLLN